MTKCNKSVYLANKSIDMIDAVNKGYTDGYNKAIDDFVKELKARSIKVSTVKSHIYLKAVGTNEIDKIAQQMKSNKE